MFTTFLLEILNIILNTLTTIFMNFFYDSIYFTLFRLDSIFYTMSENPEYIKIYTFLLSSEHIHFHKFYQLRTPNHLQDLLQIIYGTLIFTDNNSTHPFLL